MNPPLQSTTRETDQLRAVFWAVLLIGVSMVLLSGVFRSSATGGVALGAGLAVANLAAFTYIVRGTIEPSASRGPVILLALFKLLVMTVGLYLVLSAGWIELLPLAAGYGALPMGIVLGQLQPARRAGA